MNCFEYYFNPFRQKLPYHPEQHIARTGPLNYHYFY
jgi:hypothetical protein